MGKVIAYGILVELLLLMSLLLLPLEMFLLSTIPMVGLIRRMEIDVQKLESRPMKKFRTLGER